MSPSPELQTLIEEAARAGITFRNDAGTLRMKAASKPSADLLDRLRPHKEALLASLDAVGNRPHPASLPARIVAFGGISTIAPGRPLVKTARIHDGTPMELVDELREGGWNVEWKGSPAGWKTFAPRQERHS